MTLIFTAWHRFERNTSALRVWQVAWRTCKPLFPCNQIHPLPPTVGWIQCKCQLHAKPPLLPTFHPQSGAVCVRQTDVARTRILRALTWTFNLVRHRSATRRRRHVRFVVQVRLHSAGSTSKWLGSQPCVFANTVNAITRRVVAVFAVVSSAYTFKGNDLVPIYESFYSKPDLVSQNFIDI